MQELRLLGIHTDGEHLLLVSPGGNRYRLPVDDEVRNAVRRAHHDASHVRPTKERVAVSPREIQRRVRSGMSAEQIADEFDVPVEHIERYEGPVLAERAHIADLAQRQQLRNDHGDQVSLGDVVEERLARRSAEGAHWDSWRLDTGSWLVQLTFRAGGKQRGARWEFHPSRAHLEALDDEARWFMHSDDARDMPPTVAEVFGIASAGSDSPASAAEPAPEPSFASTEELLNHLQTRRVTPSRPTNDDDLPPAAHPAASDTRSGRTDQPGGSADHGPVRTPARSVGAAPENSRTDEDQHGGSAKVLSVRSDAHMRPQTTSNQDSTSQQRSQLQGQDYDGDNVTSLAGASRDANGDTNHDGEVIDLTNTDSDATDAAGQSRETTPADKTTAAKPKTSARKNSETSKSKARRHKVPSWDEIMFGTKD